LTPVQQQTVAVRGGRERCAAVLRVKKLTYVFDLLNMAVKKLTYVFDLLNMAVCRSVAGEETDLRV